MTMTSNPLDSSSAPSAPSAGAAATTTSPLYKIPIDSLLQALNELNPKQPLPLSVQCLSAFIPQAGEMADDLLKHIENQASTTAADGTRSALQLAPDSIPAICFLSALKTNVCSGLIKEVQSGDKTAEAAYKEINDLQDLTPQLKRVTQIGLLTLGLNPATSDRNDDTVFHMAAEFPNSQFMKGVLTKADSLCTLLFLV